MRCGEDEHAAEDGAETDVMTVVRDELRAALNDARCVQENMLAVQKKLLAAQIDYRQLGGSLRAAMDDMRMSHIAFALLQLTYMEAQKASCQLNDQLNELPTTEKQLHAVRMACTLAERTRVLAHKAYAEMYVSVQDAELAIIQHKEKLAARDERARARV
jgi:hypothetical protein